MYCFHTLKIKQASQETCSQLAYSIAESAVADARFASLRSLFCSSLPLKCLRIELFRLNSETSSNRPRVVCLSSVPAPVLSERPFTYATGVPMLAKSFSADPSERATRAGLSPRSRSARSRRAVDGPPSPPRSFADRAGARPTSHAAKRPRGGSGEAWDRLPFSSPTVHPGDSESNPVEDHEQEHG